MCHKHQYLSFVLSFDKYDYRIFDDKGVLGVSKIIAKINNLFQFKISTIIIRSYMGSLSVAVPAPI